MARTALLRGGSRDGETTVVSEDLQRILAASQAPGLIEAYDATDELAPVDGDSEPAAVYEFSEQLPFGDLAPELIHMPQTPGS